MTRRPSHRNQEQDTSLRDASLRSRHLGAKILIIWDPFGPIGPYLGSGYSVKALKELYMRKYCINLEEDPPMWSKL